MARTPCLTHAAELKPIGHPCYGQTVSESIANLDHQIILARDNVESAEFLTGILGLAASGRQSIFTTVMLGNQTTILFKTVQTDFPGQHYAFRVSAKAFRTILQRVQARGIAFWSTPQGGGVGETYELNGETGFYFHDPSGHQLEVLTDTGV